MVFLKTCFSHEKQVRNSCGGCIVYSKFLLNISSKREQDARGDAQAGTESLNCLPIFYTIQRVMELEATNQIPFFSV